MAKRVLPNRSARGKRECRNKEMNRIGVIAPKVFANASSSGKSKGRSTLTKEEIKDLRTARKRFIEKE